MSKITMDPKMVQQLLQAEATVELIDQSGRVIGRFVPTPRTPLEPQIDEAEIQRRLRAGGGRSLAAIMADLEKRA